MVTGVVLLVLYEGTGSLSFHSCVVFGLLAGGQTLVIMGSSYSQAEIERYASVVYENALRETCLIPDIGIDESLEKYSGLDSNRVLQTYSNDLVHSVPRCESGI